VPLSSKTGKPYPCEAMVSVGSIELTTMADQLITVSKERLAGYMGSLSQEEMCGVDTAVGIQLGLAA
jgi:mRNA interferase MazF